MLSKVDLERIGTNMSNTGRERDAEARDSKSQQPLYSQNEIMSVKSKWVNMQNTRKNLQNESTYL